MARSSRKPNLVKMPSSHTRSTADSPGEIDERIARRAYEIYEARGHIDGADLNDWLQAERELRNMSTRNAG